jgi:TRAP-type uncharacterized transport system substrate-binding protein
MGDNTDQDVAGDKSLRSRLLQKITTISWWALAQSLLPVLILSAAGIWLALHFVRPAPPRHLTIASGPSGSAFERNALRYKKILARNGIELTVVNTRGSIENLERLSDPNSGIDIALVQSGVPGPDDDSDLTSLGSMFYQPLMIFYRGAKPIERLSELSGKRIAVGPEGSGTRALALALLKANEIEPGGPTQLLDLEGERARTAILHKQVEAIFLTGDSAAPATIREMLHSDDVKLFDFSRADAYVRRFSYLSKLRIPTGAFDIGEDLPPTDVALVAPTVELLSHSDLHPALCDLLIEAAMEVHGRGTLYQQPGQFPNASVRTVAINTEAARYYKSGNKNITYEYLPFWLASLVNRALVVLVPIIVLLIPGLRLLPSLYRWRVDSRIYRRYGQLMAVEREALREHLSEEQHAALLLRLGEIERDIISHKVPGSHAEQVYVLRQHINFARQNLARKMTKGGLP